jgi:uncharacterized phiE125 gp8 family phage protein
MKPHISIVSQPSSEPITLAQASAHLRVDSDDDQGYIMDLVAVAREYFDSMTGRSSARMGYLLTAARWEDLMEIDTEDVLQTLPLERRVIRIYRTPLVEVASVKYFAPDASELTELDPTDYRVITTSEPGAIQFVGTPPDVADRADAIQIEFAAGNDCATAMAKHAIRMLTAHFYEQRTPVAFASVTEIPFTLRAIIENQKIRGHFA